MPEGRLREDVVLTDVVERARLYPGTTTVPPQEERDSLWPGDLVKVVVVHDGLGDVGERIWVKVLPLQVGQEGYRGEVVSFPVACCVEAGDVLKFGPENVADVYEASSASAEKLN